MVFIGERKRCVSETSLGCLPYAPRLGIKPPIWVCALTLNQTWDTLVHRMTLQPSESPARAKHFPNCLVLDTPSGSRGGKAHLLPLPSQPGGKALQSSSLGGRPTMPVQGREPSARLSCLVTSNLTQAHTCFNH